MAIVNLDFVDLVAYTDSQTTSQVVGRATTAWRSHTQVRAEPNKLYAVNENYRVKQGVATFRLQSQLNADYDPHVRFFIQALLLTANSAEQRSLVASSNLVCNNNIIVGKKSFVEIDIGALGINWTPDTEYRFEFSNDFVRDQGVDDIETAAPGFTLEYLSNSTVAIEKSNPVRSDNNVKNNTFIEIEFDRQVRPNFAGGNIYLYESPNTLVSTYNIKQDVQFIGFEKIKFSTLGKLKSNTTYYLLTDDDVIKDYDNFSFDITNSNTFRFTTSLFEFPELISFKFVNAQLVLNYIRYRNYSSDLNVTVDSDFIPTYFKGIVNEIYPVVTDQQTDAVKTARTVKTFDVTTDIVPSATYVANGAGSYQSVSNILGRITYNRGGLARQFDLRANIAPNAVKTARTVRTFNAVSTVNARTNATFRTARTFSSVFRNFANTDLVPLNIGTFFAKGSLISGNSIAVSNGSQVSIINAVDGSLIRTINCPGSNTLNRFGYSIAFQNNNLLVGDPGDKRAYLFNASTGNLLFTFSPISQTIDGDFGWDVALDGNWIVVGAPGDINNIKRSYLYSSSTGALVRTIAETGFAVAAAGDFAIFGDARFSEINNVAVETPVKVYNIVSGALVYTFNNPNPFGSTVNDGFGSRLSAKGNALIVGSWGEDELAQDNSGKSYQYNLSNGTLTRTFNNPNDLSAPGFDLFGYSVAVSTNYVLVGAPREESLVRENAGVVYIFNLATGAKVSRLNNTDAYISTGTTGFGMDVFISDNYMLVARGSLVTDGVYRSPGYELFLYKISDL